MSHRARDLRRHARNGLFVTALLCLFCTAAGCLSSPYRAHPDFRLEAADLQAPLIMTPDVRVYDFTAQGRWELRDDWSERVNKNLLLALRRGLERKNFAMEPFFSGDVSCDPQMDEIRDLYTAVEKSIRLHTFGPHLFPKKIDHFEYSLGDMEGFLRSQERDSLVLVTGFHQIMRDSHRTGISLALVDSSGCILWYCMKVYDGNQDLRNPNEAATVIDSLLGFLSTEEA